MNERSRYDVAIVGGGLVGASAALALTRRGLRVALFERRDCGAQASGVNYGGVRCQPPGRTAAARAARAAHLGSAARADRQRRRVRRVRPLRLARSDADLDALDAYATLAGEHGLPLQVMRGAAFRRRYPGSAARRSAARCARPTGTRTRASCRRVRARGARGRRRRVRTRAVDDVRHDGTQFHIHAGAHASRRG
jgi:sarcosine oxidase subunit beta